MDRKKIDIGIENLLEVDIKSPENFLKIKETLSRIGIASRKENVLFQSCHILHKKGKYYITHFKELFALDGKSVNLEESDIHRRNTIAILLEDWELLSIISDINEEDTLSVKKLKIVTFKDKSNWQLKSKYNIGRIKIQQ
jgi:hypothetical protein